MMKTMDYKGVQPAFVLAASLCVTLFCLCLPVQAEQAADRFFFMGPGRIHIKNLHTELEASVSLLNADGSLNEEGFTKVDEVFGFPTKEEGEHISPRLIFMLDYLSNLVAPGKTIEMESGYRSPEYNEGLRSKGGIVAKTSAHMDGMALDFSIDGVDGKRMWEFIRGKNFCGVGYYGGKSIHLDSSRPRFWEAATSKVTSGESEFNRHIYVSTDYDRYKAGDKVRLSFSGVSDFGFGMKPAVHFIEGSGGGGAVATARIEGRDDPECIVIPDRKTSHFVYVSLPQNLHAGRWRVRVDFCRRPSEKMPLTVNSNEIEILRR